MNTPLNYPPTPEQTAEALEESIKHWTRLAYGFKSSMEDVSAEYCSLCHAFVRHENNPLRFTSCEGCPIAAKTGRPYCDDSPYYTAQSILSKLALDSYDANPDVSYSERYQQAMFHPDFQSAASLMVNYLESLRITK